MGFSKEDSVPGFGSGGQEQACWRMAGSELREGVPLGAAARIYMELQERG